jgi:hypothetical protein
LKFRTEKIVNVVSEPESYRNVRRRMSEPPAPHILQRVHPNSDDSVVADIEVESSSSLINSSMEIATTNEPVVAHSLNDASSVSMMEANEVMMDTTSNDQRFPLDETNPSVKKENTRKYEMVGGDSMQVIHTDMSATGTDTKPIASITTAAPVAATVSPTTVTPPPIPPYVYDIISPDNPLTPDIVRLWDDVGNGIDKNQTGTCFCGSFVYIVYSMDRRSVIRTKILSIYTPAILVECARTLKNLTLSYL